jgi:hypothetical protein
MHYAEGDFFMPMSKLMEQVIAEVVKLPEKQQDELVELFIEFIHSDEAEEAEWDALVQSPESQRFLEKMVREVKPDWTQWRALGSLEGNTVVTVKK